EAIPEKVKYSDAICTALQITNHLQDLGKDIAEGRPLYLPREEMERFGVNADLLLQRRFTPILGNFVLEIADQSRQLFEYGSLLVQQLQWPLNLEIAAIIEGGLGVLKKIEEQDGNTLRNRPKLNKWDKAGCLWRAKQRTKS
ncbi:MAG: squalene/phytoene synthase family protein, partial [Magnetococcales bacterium]|nr:squalene/phytoene synthase family protein [Magnetococcales bacterium]